MVTRSPSFGNMPAARDYRGDSTMSSRLRTAYVDGWGRDDKPAVPMHRSRIPTFAAVLVGASVGVAAVALYGSGAVGGATLGETDVTRSEPHWALNPEYQRATLVQARALTAVHEQGATATPSATATNPDAATNADLSVSPPDSGSADSSTSMSSDLASPRPATQPLSNTTPGANASQAAAGIDARVPDVYRESVPAASERAEPPTAGAGTPADAASRTGSENPY